MHDRDQKQSPLVNLGILVTRAEEQAHELNTLIMQMGGQPLPLPLLTMTTAPDQPALKNAIRDLGQYDIAIFTSANAARFIIPLWQQYWSPAPQGLKIVSIGAATQRELAKHHIPVHLMPLQYNSEALLELAEFNTPRHQAIIIFSGAGGRDLLEVTLNQRGHHVHKAICYQRVVNPVGPQLSIYLQASRIAYITATSQEILTQLGSIYLPPEHKTLLLSLPVIVISPRLVAHAKHIGFREVYSAENASDAAIINTIIEITASRGKENAKKEKAGNREER